MSKNKRPPDAAPAVPTPFQPRVILDWKAHERQYRAVVFNEQGGLSIQTMLGGQWQVVANPSLASWEHSLVVVALRLFEKVNELSPKAEAAV